MSLFEYLRTWRRAKEVGGNVIKDKYGYNVCIKTDLKAEDFTPIPPEEVLRTYENEDLEKLDPRMRELTVKMIQKAKEDIQQAKDERWRKK